MRPRSTPPFWASRAALVVLCLCLIGGCGEPEPIRPTRQPDAEEGPDSLEVASNFAARAAASYAAGNFDRAIEDYTQAIRLDPDLAIAYSNRGQVWNAVQDYDKAISDFNEALRLDPDDTRAYNGRGNAFHRKGEYAKAIADYDEVIRRAPSNDVAYYNRAFNWNELGELERARDDYDRAVAIAPDQSLYHLGRGLVEEELGAYKEAAVDFQEAVDLEPTSLPAQHRLAWLLATAPEASCRDGHRAVEAAQTAARMSNWTDPGVLSTLAAANAEAGDFEQAVRWQTQAISLLSEEDQPLARDRLAIYKSGQPFHQTAADATSESERPTQIPEANVAPESVPED